MVNKFLFVCLLFPTLCFGQNTKQETSPTKNFSFNPSSTTKPLTHPFRVYNQTPYEFERLEIKIKLPWGLAISKTRYFRTGSSREIWRTTPRPINQGSMIELKNRWAFGGGITSDRVRDVTGPTQIKKRGFVFSIRKQF